jgi:hypothetical protein
MNKEYDLKPIMAQAAAGRGKTLISPSNIADIIYCDVDGLYSSYRG